MELIHKSENALCQAVSHRNQSVFHVFRRADGDRSGFHVYIFEYEIQHLGNTYACAV